MARVLSRTEFDDRVFRHLKARGPYAVYTDIVHPDIMRNEFLKKNVHVLVPNIAPGLPQPAKPQATALCFTLKTILESNDKTSLVAIQAALMALQKVMLGVNHQATRFDGFFLLVRVFNLRMFKWTRVGPPSEWEWKAVVGEKLEVGPTYTFRLLDKLMRSETPSAPPESGMISIVPLTQFWFDLAYNGKMEQVGNFVNDLCGAVAMKILAEKHDVWPWKPEDIEPGATRKNPMQIERRVAGGAAALPPLHMLSLR